MFSRSNGSWAHMQMKSKEISTLSFPRAFCSSVSLCGTNRKQVFRLPFSRTKVCAVFFLMPNFSTIKLSVSRRSSVIICRTFSIISEVLLVDGRPERGSSSSFPSLRESVNTFSAQGFPPVHLHQHSTRLCCSFSQFVAKRVCTLLHCAVTLPLTLTSFNWLQSVYTASHMQSMLCVDSPHISEEPCVCALTCAKLPFRYDFIHQNF